MGMTFTQLRDVFEHVKQAHRRAAEYCKQAARPSETGQPDERLRSLADYFQQWEERLARFLDSLNDQQPDLLLETWLQFSGTDNVDQALDDLCATSIDEPRKLIDKSLVLQEQVVVLFEQLTGELDPSEQRDQMESLTEYERQAARELATAIVTQYDV